jgi:hypothetical protein
VSFVSRAAAVRRAIPASTREEQEGKRDVVMLDRFHVFSEPAMVVMASSIVAWTLAGADRVAHGAAERCEEAVDQPVTLRVRIVPAGIEEPVSELVRAEVEAIWDPYNVTFVWMSSWEPRSGTSPPTLWVQFVDQRVVSAGMPRYQAIAWILFVAGVPQHYIRVSVPAARQLLQTRSWWDGKPLSAAMPTVQQEVLGRVMGRALAHEIGHYLFASSQHAKSGLMRAALPANELVHPGGVHSFRIEDGAAHAFRAARLARCVALAGVPSAGRP